MRGCVCEVESLLGDEEEEEEAEENDRLARAFFEDLLQSSGVDASAIKVIGPVKSGGDGLIRQYMDLLKFARS